MTRAKHVRPSTTGRKLAAGALAVPMALTMVGTAAATEPVLPSQASDSAADQMLSHDALEAKPAKVKKNETEATVETRQVGSKGQGADDTAAQPVRQNDPKTADNPKSEDINNGAGNGANQEGPYDATESTGENQGNGKSPENGSVGNADNMNPPGQAPNGETDGNKGFECDDNKGVGDKGGNPAHTGCDTAPPAVDEDGESSIVDEDESKPGVKKDEGVTVTPTVPEETPNGGSTPITDQPDAQPGTGGGTPVTNPGNGNGGGSPVVETPVTVTPVVPATPIQDRTTPAAGSGGNGSGVVSNGAAAPQEVGRSVGQARDARVSPAALPYTGSTTSLLLALGTGLVVAGGGFSLLSRRETAGVTA